MSNDTGGTDNAIAQKSAQKTKRPRMFKVLLHNDHYTTMDFVVEVLEMVFGKSGNESVQIMLSVHHTGFGVAGVYAAAIAETKIATVRSMASDQGFPLKCSMEPA